MNEFGQEHLDALTHRVQFGGDEVVNAKVYSLFFQQGAGSATLAMAYAAALFTDELMEGLEGERNIYSYAYTMNNVTTAPYFSARCHIGVCISIFIEKWY